MFHPWNCSTSSNLLLDCSQIYKMECTKLIMIIRQWQWYPFRCLKLHTKFRNMTRQTPELLTRGWYWLADHNIVLWQILARFIMLYVFKVHKLFHHTILKHTTTFWWFAWWSLPNMALDCVNFNVHFETSCVVSQLCPDDIFKQVSNPVELHDVFWLTL